MKKNVKIKELKRKKKSLSAGIRKKLKKPLTLTFERGTKVFVLLVADIAKDWDTTPDTSYRSLFHKISAMTKEIFMGNVTIVISINPATPMNTLNAWKYIMEKELLKNSEKKNI